MNSKGQLSIIAALLIAVILTSTVIATFSTIRNSPIEETPQVLSAVDETNFAIKQILGFTLGYYGSILQVTGNTSYARELARDYFYSGLTHVANIHPEWATSFSASKPDLHIDWFTNTSYSRGNLTTKYSLIGLGIYGVTYQTSCELHVQISDTTTENQASLQVTRDDNEPVVTLGKRNFKFYRYHFSNSTWELVHPETEPLAFANGTYLIDLPTDVDPKAYLVLVEDQRGIRVVASSFNSITSTFTWNPTPELPSRYAVVGSEPEITGAPDGTYATINQDGTCEVTAYESGVAKINQVYFNITYYGGGDDLVWSSRLDEGNWTTIGNLIGGGNVSSPLTATYDATNLRTVWTWNNLNTTDIRFEADDKAYVDAIYVTATTAVGGNYSSIQNETIVVELLQNGTLKWLGQNLQLTTAPKPIPPIPVKAFRVNQTINGLNQEVPFQIEDWASDYTVPMGLTGNASLFNNRMMFVCLVTSQVSNVTIWWDGSDDANQTAYAFSNQYFTADDLASKKLTNGITTLQIENDFTVTSTTGNAMCTANFMRVNNEWSIYGADPAYVIHHGVVRDIIQQEAEWGGGVDECPNLYAHIVLTLPANTTYYTTQLRFMFVDSEQSRTISDLCPIELSVVTGQPQTENGIADGFPIVSDVTGVFYNSSDTEWAHHWSQFISNMSGGGIMFPDDTNENLYFFDTIAGTTTGGIQVTNSDERTIELMPVALTPVQFEFAVDITWYGAVVTFDDSTPIYKEASGEKTGLWITIECPPTITVTTAS